MDSHKHSSLPTIGDLIRFSDKWNSIFSDDFLYVHGIIYNIKTLEDLQSQYVFDDEWFRSTLCYPLTVDPYESNHSLIFHVYWFTDEQYICETYKLVNQEWFTEGLFDVIKKSD